MCDFSPPSISLPSLPSVNIDVPRSLGDAIGVVTHNVVENFRSSVGLATHGLAGINANGNLEDGILTRGVASVGKFIERGVREGGEAISGAATRRQMQEQADAALKRADDQRTKQISDNNYRAMMNDRQASNLARSGRGSQQGQTLGSAGLSNTTFLGL